MYSEVLENYTGPEMVSFMFDGKDITDKMKALYGRKRNWQANIYTYEELFGEGVQDKGSASITKVKTVVHIGNTTGGSFSTVLVHKILNLM